MGKTMASKTIRYCDLFAGVGGFRYGLESINRDKNRKSQKDTKKNDEEGKGLESKKGKKASTKKRQPLKHNNSRSEQIKFTCVYSNEWDKYASSVYRRQYAECNSTDITKVSAKEIPDHDLLCGGFPCQSFSVAGKRGGFNDTRGTLFFDIARILKEKRPRYLLLENVKGLLSHDKGKTFQTMLGVLSDLGYGVQWQVLNSKNFGVPQNRERVFIVGHLREKPRPKIFPIFGQNKATLKELTTGQSQGMRAYSTDGVSTTLASRAGGWGAKTGLYMVDDPSRKKGIVDKNISPTLRKESHGNLPSVVIGIQSRVIYLGI